MPFDGQPWLKGDLVELRPLCAEDYDQLYAVASDPLIWQQHPVSNRHEQESFRPFFDESLACGGALVVVDSTSREIIGSSRFHGYDPVQREVEIGWTFLARKCWGGRYNGQVKALMLKHAFKFVDAVVFRVGTHNLRSQRAVEKLGAVRVSSRPDDGGRESFLYRITSTQSAAP